MSDEHKTIFLVVIVLKDRGQILHVAFDDIEQAHEEAKRLEPRVKKKRDDFIRCDVVPVPFYPK